MSDVPGDHPVPGEKAPRAPLQPWSDAARNAGSRKESRRTVRRRQLSRFNEGLASMLVREQEEDEVVGALLTFALKTFWAPVMLAGGVLIHRFTGTTEYSPGTLAGFLALSVIIGLSIDPLWRMFKGVDQPRRPSRPDPYGPEESIASFTRLGLLQDDARADGEDVTIDGDGCDGGDGGDA